MQGNQKKQKRLMYNVRYTLIYNFIKEKSDNAQ